MSGWLHDTTGGSFDGFVQLAPIAADVALVWAVQAYLGQRGASDRTRLTAAALVALGPSFIVISGYHGQLDPLAILFPLLGLWYWERAEGGQRAIVAGLLIGAGGAIKLPPLIVLLALLPTGRSWRERGVLFGTAAATVLLSLAPFLAADLDGTIEGIRGNQGVPAFGGISLLIQPEFAGHWLGTDPDVQLSAVSERLFDHAATVAALPILATAAFVFRRRLAPAEAAVLLFITVYAFGINFAFQYVVAGLVFFLIAERIWQVAAIQAALFIPTVLLYVRERRDLPLENVYAPIMRYRRVAGLRGVVRVGGPPRARGSHLRVTGARARETASPSARSTSSSKPIPPPRRLRQQRRLGQARDRVRLEHVQARRPPRASGRRARSRTARAAGRRRARASCAAARDRVGHVGRADEVGAADLVARLEVVEVLVARHRLDDRQRLGPVGPLDHRHRQVAPAT